jgi:D-amino-acid dehydrogenase
VNQRRAVVIGGGFIGAWSAYFLAKSNWQVTIVDQGAFGGACSRGNCGYLSPSHALPLAQPGAVRNALGTIFQSQSALKIRWGTALRNLGWFWKFMRRCNETQMLENAVGISALLNTSRQMYDDLIKAEAIDCDFQTNGCLFTFQSKKAFDHFAIVNQTLTDKCQMPARRIDPAELEAMEPALKPGVCAGAYHYERDAQIRPERFLREMRRVLETLGVKFIEHSTVTNITATTVQTIAAAIPADAIVVATGAWTPKWNTMLGAKIPIIPGKGYSITMARPEHCPRSPIIFEEHHVAVSPFADGYRIGSTMEFAGYDARTNPKRLQILKDAAKVYLKTPEAEPLEDVWWGWRPMVYDGKPIIDRSPKWPNVVIAAGHGMLGVSMGPATGLLVSELINDRTPTLDARHYSLQRFG